MTSPDFRFELDDDRRVLVAHGDLDEGATVELRSLLADVTDQLTSGLTIDLTDVDFLPSSAIGVLATAQTTARRNGAAITFVAAQGSVSQRVLTVCGLDYAESVSET